MATSLQKLIAALRGNPQQPMQPEQPLPMPPQVPPQMGGMAGQAQQQIVSRPYQLYVQEQQAQGMPAVPFDQFMQGAR